MTRILTPKRAAELAGRNGTRSVIGKQLPILRLPSDGVSFEECAIKCFPVLARSHRFFKRGRTLVELAKSDSQYTLEEIEPAAFRSRLEKYFSLFKERRLPEGNLAFKPSRCSTDSALALLKTEAAFHHFPAISILVNSPIFLELQGELQLLGKGYHEILGGIYVTKDRAINELPLEQAKQSLLELLTDFNFVSDSDRSRALAGLISPALRFGGLLTADFPLDLAEATESQSGKTYRQRIVCALYGEKAFVINRREQNGVGSLDEAISEGLISGQPFLMFENVRGPVASQLLESAIRGEGRVSCRRAYSRGVQVETAHVCFMLSSNQAEATPDLANRAIIIRLRKQPASHQFKIYEEGDLLAHIQARPDHYLSCIYSVLGEWHKRGRPRTEESRHDFREWCQTMDWIVQEIFGLAPLLDGHRAEQLRLSNQNLRWLRLVALAVEKENRLNTGLRASQIADICEGSDINIPGCGLSLAGDQIPMQIGKVLKRIFAEQHSIEVSGFNVVREIIEEYNEDRKENMTLAHYTFARLSQRPPSSE